jgi:hypothetical protein
VIPETDNLRRSLIFTFSKFRKYDFLKCSKTWVCKFSTIGTFRILRTCLIYRFLEFRDFHLSRFSLFANRTFCLHCCLRFVALVYVDMLVFVVFLVLFLLAPFQFGPLGLSGAFTFPQLAMFFVSLFC